MVNIQNTPRPDTRYYMPLAQASVSLKIDAQQLRKMVAREEIRGVVWLPPGRKNVRWYVAKSELPT